METNYYNKSNNFSAPIRKEPKPYTPPRNKENDFEKCACDVPEEHSDNTSCKISNNSGLLSDLKSDDFLLLGLILMLLSDRNSDRLLLLVLGYLFLCGKNN